MRPLRKVLTILLCTLLFIFVFAASAIGAVITAHTTDKTASIPVELTTNFSSEITIECGAPGDIVLDFGSKFPLGIGATITILDIYPDSAFAEVLNGDTSSLSDDGIGELTEYFTEESGRLINGLLLNILFRFTIFMAGGILILVILFVLGRKIQWSVRRTRLALTFALAVCLVVTGMTVGISALDTLGVKSDTPAQIPRFSIDISIGTITFRGAISKPAEMINDIVSDTDKRGWEFSDLAKAAVKTTLAGTRYKQKSNDVMLVHVSDIHDNLYMYPVIGAIIQATGATAVLDTGDVTKTGSRIEGTYVSQYVKTMLNAGADNVYYTRGNHDTKTTDRQMKAAGATVLNGIIKTYDGLVIAGYGDPMHTALATSIHTNERTDRIKAQDTRIKTELEEYSKENGKRVNILMTHAPKSGKAARKAGLADMQLAGHKHKAEPVITAGDTILIEANNANGEAQIGQNEMFGTAIGPIRQNVIIDVIIWNAKTEKYSYFTVTITPAGDAYASDIMPLTSEVQVGDVGTNNLPDDTTGETKAD